MPNSDGTGARHCCNKEKGTCRRGQGKKRKFSNCLNPLKKQSFNNIDSSNKQEQKEFLEKELQRLEEEKRMISEQIKNLEAN